MKATVEEPTKDKQPAYYPGFYIGDDSPIVLEVLNYGKTYVAGIVRRGNDTHDVGYYSNNWDMAGFIRMPVGTKITLIQD